MSDEDIPNCFDGITKTTKWRLVLAKNENKQHQVRTYFDREIYFAVHTILNMLFVLGGSTSNKKKNLM